MVPTTKYYGTLYYCAGGDWSPLIDRGRVGVVLAVVKRAGLPDPSLLGAHLVPFRSEDRGSGEPMQD